jgi:hypothetical protein
MNSSGWLVVKFNQAIFFLRSSVLTARLLPGASFFRNEDHG